MSKVFTGLLPDNRTTEEKEFDVQFEEIYPAGTAEPSYYASPNEAKTYVGVFPIDNQFLTSSCVAHSRVLAQSIFNYLKGQPFVQLASMFVYRLRSNYPGEGMIPANANKIISSEGAPGFADMPTPQTEAEADAMVVTDALTEAALPNAGGTWITIGAPTNVDIIAFVSNNLGFPCDILIFANENEWSLSTPQILDATLTIEQSEVQHNVTVLPHSAYTDPTTGIKYVIIQDSALFGNLAFRNVSADFIAARCYGAEYPSAFESKQPETKPKCDLQTDLTIGSTGADVVVLQTCLQYLGYMPNVVNGQNFAPTGYYGGMTKSAVLALQNANAEEILTPEGISVATGYCGSSTRAWLNKTFPVLDPKEETPAA